MQAVGDLRNIAARQLMLTLCAGFDASKAMRDGKVDGLIIAGLEMEKCVVLQGSPIAPIKRVPADEVQRARDHLART